MVKKGDSKTYVTTQETIKRATIKEMKELGTYKTQYNRLINVYSGILHRYLRALAQFEKEGYRYETETAAGNSKKSGLLSAIENMQKDILQYSDRLCLNPRSLENVTAESNSKSTLATVLSELSGR